MDPVKDPPP